MEQSVEVAEDNSTNQILIENKPPFYDNIKSLLEVPFDSVVRNSRKFEEQYLAWQAVRHMSSASDRLTGFEGYFVGSNIPNAMYTEIEQLGTSALESLSRTPVLKRKVLDTLEEKTVYPEALMWLHETLGSITGRLRARTSTNPLAKRFNEATHIKVATKSITYEHTDGKTIQTYHLPVLRIPEELNGSPNGEIVNSPGYQFMKNLGKVGHPLVRASLGSFDDLTQMRIRNQMWR